MTPAIVEQALSMLIHGEGAERYVLPPQAAETLFGSLSRSPEIGAAAHALADLATMLETAVGSPSAAELVRGVLVRAMPLLKREAARCAAQRAAATAERGRSFQRIAGVTLRAPMFGAPTPPGAISARVLLPPCGLR